MEKFLIYVEGMLELFGIFGFMAVLFLSILLIILCLCWDGGKLFLVFLTFVFYLVAMATPRPGAFMRLPVWLLLSASASRWVLLILVCLFGWGSFFKRFQIKYFLISVSVSILVLLSSSLTKTPSESVPRTAWLVWMLFGLPLMGRAIVLEYQGFYAFLRWWRATGLLLVVLFVIATIRDPYGSFLGGYRGFLENPNAYGWLAVSMTVPILSLFSYEKKLGLFSILQLLWWCPTVFLSASRSSAVLMVIVFLAFGASNLKNIKSWFIGAGVLLALFFTYRYFVTYEEVEVLATIGLSGRESLWMPALESFRMRPIWGHGAGFVETELRLILQKDLHNSYLLLLLDYGIVGTIILLPIFVIPLVKAFTLRKRVRVAWGNVCETLKWFLVGMLLWAFFEAWLAAAGSSILYMYLLLLGVLNGVVEVSSTKVDMELLHSLQHNIDGNKVVSV